MLLAGCNTGFANSDLTPGASAMSRTELYALEHARETSVHGQSDTYPGLKDLYITDGSIRVALFRNKSYKYVGSISYGLSSPDGDFLNTGGYLYVANGPNIQVYSPGATTPKFTYTAGIQDAVDVAVDIFWNAYEADQNGFVNEYPSFMNYVSNSCSVGGVVEGVALDKAGDVFVSTYVGSANLIVEYPGGLSGCPEKVLGVRLNYAAFGIAVDKHNNLIVADEGEVDEVPPPYTNVSRQIAPNNWLDAQAVHLSKSGKLLFVADPVDQYTSVIAWPSGKYVGPVGLPYIRYPMSAVDGPNSTY